MHKIPMIRFYFPLDALHVSDGISPSSGATFISCTSHLVYAGTCRYHTSGCRVAIATRQPDVCISSIYIHTEFLSNIKELSFYLASLLIGLGTGSSAAGL